MTTLDFGSVRAIISNAYYDARNAGQTMETAATSAADGVLGLLTSFLDEAEQALPESRTPEAHGKLDLIRELRQTVAGVS